MILCAATVLFAQERNSKMSKDEAMIRAIVKQMETGWNAHDGKAFPRHLPPMRLCRGQWNVCERQKRNRKRSHRIFTTIYKDSRTRATIKSVRFLRKDVAVVHVEGIWNLPSAAKNAKRDA